MEEEATRYLKTRIVNFSLVVLSIIFIIAEQDILTETIYLWFITHFIFNIKYDKSLINVGLFFQDNIL